MSDANALDRAIAALGGAQAFCLALAISPRTLANWRKTGVPDTRWSDVAAAAGGAVTAAALAQERAVALAPEAA